jgi:hypothetical protein
VSGARCQGTYRLQVTRNRAQVTGYRLQGFGRGESELGIREPVRFQAHVALALRRQGRFMAGAVWEPPLPCSFQLVCQWIANMPVNIPGQKPN